MSWKKLKPIKGGFGGCLNCGYQHDEAPMDMVIAVGFGIANVTRDGEEVYNGLEHEDGQDFWTTQDAENEALKDPDHDWRITMNAPLSYRVYQRHDSGKWMLVKRGPGFA